MPKKAGSAIGQITVLAEKLAAEMRRTGHIGEDIIGLLKKDYFRE